MANFKSLPTPRTTDLCNPLSLRIYKKKYENNNEIIDGGKVVCHNIDSDLNIKSKDKKADWLITKDSIFYLHPQSLTIKEFSFYEWALRTHLGFSVTKLKGLHCIRLFKIINPFNSLESQFLLEKTVLENTLEYYDFYVENGK